MSNYDHSWALRTVAKKDQAHVEHMLTKLDKYAKSGGKEGLGDFLTALVLGDLLEAVAHADDVNGKYLQQYAQYIYSRLPGTHVNLGRGVFQAIRRVRAAASVPISREMVDRAAAIFEAQLHHAAQELRQPEQVKAGG